MNKKIIWGVIVVVILVVGGWYLLKPACTDDCDGELREISNATSTSQLKTYSNSQYGFEIKYPTQFQIQNQTPNQLDVTNSQFCVEKAKTQQPGDIFAGCQYLSVRAQKNNIIVEGQNVTKSAIVIAGITGEKIISNEEYFSIISQIEKNGQYYVFSVYSNV